MNHSIDYFINQLIHHSGLFDSNLNTLNPSKAFDFSNETILITGAAGTVGKELFKQLLTCKHKRIVLIDIAESALYDLSVEFELNTIDTVYVRVANINDYIAIKHIYDKHKPTVVFHCAAYKHVPLMEQTPYQAVSTNILATLQLANISAKNKVKKFVFVSSDKAVEPISIMGMTKRIAENYLNHTSKNSPTQFIITRFGNVLGSNGSVLPVFLKQIALGLPLTITAETMTRYFITKEKVCQLILESTFLNNLKTNHYVFKMGPPVKIMALAKEIISISNTTNTAIKITGKRTGEKRHETLISNNEISFPTKHKDILLIQPKEKPEQHAVDLSELHNISPYHEKEDIERLLKKYI